jgi:hypothetical protein
VSKKTQNIEHLGLLCLKIDLSLYFMESHALPTELAGQMLHFRINSDIISVTTIDNSIRFGFAGGQNLM